MKKLLIATTVYQTLTSFLLPFARHFKQQGWQVDAMSQGVSESSECVEIFDNVWEVKWSRNPLDPSNLIGTPATIEQLVKREGYDLVHVHTPVAAFVTRYALRNLQKAGKVRVIYTAHGFHFHPDGNPLKNQIFLNLEKIAGKWTDDLVLINRTDEAAAKAGKFLPEKAIHYMPGIGVDLDYYSHNAIDPEAVAEIYQDLKIRADNPLFLVIAEFIPRKHHRDVLQAFAKLNRPQAHLALAGDGVLRSQMEAFAIELGIKDRVHFLGFRRDIPVLIKAATATILVSEQEGLPRSIMESMAIGTPVIGSDIRGIKDLLEDGNGILVKVGDIVSLTAAISDIIDNPTASEMISQRAMNYIARFDLKQIIHLHEQLYNS